MLNDQANIEDNVNEGVPSAPPPPPSEAPSAPGPVEFYRKEDTQLREILESKSSPSKLKNLLIDYQKLLGEQLESKRKEILEQESVRNLAQASYEINISELKRMPKKIIEFKDKIELLPQVPRITNERRQDLSTMFHEKLQSHEEKEKTCKVLEEPLKLTLEKEKKTLEELTSEKDKIYFKIKAVERAIDVAEKEGRFCDVAKANEADGSKKRKMVLPKDLSVYEAELRGEWELFLTIKNTKTRTTIYEPEEILALQCVMFEDEDWEGDCENILQHKLWKAVVERKDLIKGLDKTPRSNIKEILGYDIIDKHKEREACKKQEEGQLQRQSLKARRVFQREVKEMIEESASSAQENTNLEKGDVQLDAENPQNQEIVQTRKKIRPLPSNQDESQDEGLQNQEVVSSKKRPRSPNQIALITELEARHKALQQEVEAKHELFKQEQQSRLQAELALQAREAVLREQQEALLREQQEVREARNRADAELIRAKELAQPAPMTAPARIPLTFAQRNLGR